MAIKRVEVTHTTNEEGQPNGYRYTAYYKDGAAIVLRKKATRCYEKAFCYDQAELRSQDCQGKAWSFGKKPSTHAGTPDPVAVFDIDNAAVIDPETKKLIPLARKLTPEELAELEAEKARQEEQAKRRRNSERVLACRRRNNLKNVTLSQEAVNGLADYQKRHKLRSKSRALEHALAALGFIDQETGQAQK